MLLNTSILGFLRTIELNLLRGAIIDKDTGKCKYLTVKYDEKIKNQCLNISITK